MFYWCRSFLFVTIYHGPAMLIVNCDFFLYLVTSLLCRSLFSYFLGCTYKKFPIALSKVNSRYWLLSVHCGIIDIRELIFGKFCIMHISDVCVADILLW